MKPTQRNFVLATTLLTFLVFPVSAVEVHVEASEVHWIARSGDTWSLDVSGPGIESSQTFENGETPTFSLYDGKGSARSEGQYTWRLIEIPSVDDATRKAMEQARFAGSEVTSEVVDLPAGRVFSGVFRVLDGVFLTPTEEEPLPTSGLGDHGFDKLQTLSCDLVVQGDTSLEGDLFVAGSSCIGQDCDFNGGVFAGFGLDTLRLKENNLRIKFEDTSSLAGFPSNDWELTANDSANGGADRFSITDVTHGTTPFTISGDAPDHALFVQNTTGNLGLGTRLPGAELHIVDGDSPAIRLEQDASSGFTSQAWDIAGNETNFFVRDVTQGSKLPFKIKPGAPDNALFVAADGDIHLGGQSPSAKLDVVGSAEINGDLQIRTTASFVPLLVADDGPPASRVMARFANNGAIQLDLIDTQASQVWRVDHASNGSLGLDFGADAANEVTVYGAAVGSFNAGDLEVAGDVYAAGVMLTSDVAQKSGFETVDREAVLDAVASLPISSWSYKDSPKVRHIGPMAQDFHAAFGLGASQRHIAMIDAAGVSLTAVQALDQQVDSLERQVARLDQQLRQRDTEVEALQQRLAALESLLDR